MGLGESSGGERRRQTRLKRLSAGGPTGCNNGEKARKVLHIVAFCCISRVIVKFGRVGLGLKWAVVPPLYREFYVIGCLESNPKRLCQRGLLTSGYRLGGRPRCNAFQPCAVIPAYTSAWIEIRGNTGTTGFPLSSLNSAISAPSVVNPRTSNTGVRLAFCYEPPATTEAPFTLTSTSRMAAGSSSSKSSGTGKYPP